MPRNFFFVYRNDNMKSKGNEKILEIFILETINFRLAGKWMEKFCMLIEIRLLDIKY